MVGPSRNEVALRWDKVGPSQKEVGPHRKVVRANMNEDRPRNDFGPRRNDIGSNRNEVRPAQMRSLSDKHKYVVKKQDRGWTK
ncbi:hypothetical protein FNV43_RR24581 [Rhamnella rubrinervis]|uniref:Uncharacterized protein n=1 Tax=Rhamnella rubrinervis TaxID=2594499 RepID=A0A8K0GP92_9ROSA|nr:hypothetical protein FNV43_RR24581 [Rhamnella rubrinervis]